MSAKYVFISLWVIFSNYSFAQWSSDPLINTAIADTSGEQVVPKLVAASDGGCYVSWYDTRDGNYSMYLQKLDVNGAAQWAGNGLLISDQPQDSWVTDYDLTVDQNNNAVVVFNDIRNAAQWDVFAYKVAPDGSMLWGNNGIGLSVSGNTDFEAAPRVITTGNGNFVFVWSKSATEDIIVFQKLSADGQKLWGENGFTISGSAGESIAAPYLVPSNGDSVIAVWMNYSGPFWAPFAKLYAQKFDSLGNAAWNPSGTLFYDLGAMAAYYESDVCSDGKGGAYIAHYDAPSLSEFNVRVHHISTGGNLVFPVNGIKASTNSVRLHLNPSLTYLPALEQLYVFWKEENVNQDQWGLYAQNISANGSRMWSEEGKMLIGLSTSPVSFINSAAADSAIYVSYFESTPVTGISSAVKTLFIDYIGNVNWQDKVLSDISLGSKGRLQMVAGTNKNAITVWRDERNDNGDIFAQEINYDGSLGQVTTSVIHPDEVNPYKFNLLGNFPNPFNPTTTIRYQLMQSRNIDVSIFDASGRMVRSLLHHKQKSGLHEVVWNGENNNGRQVSSGIYFYRVGVEQNVFSGKMILIR